MRLILLTTLLMVLVGCGSTPYRDDYTTHVNTMPDYYQDKDLRFILDNGPSIDLRGVYSRDDTTEASPIMYQIGAGGVADLLAQIGAHSSFIKAQRNEKLAKSQELANQDIAPLREIVKGIDIEDLLGGDSSLLVGKGNKGIHIKPIFFSSTDMNKFSLNLIVWSGPAGNSSDGDKNQYKNLIQVYSSVLTDEQRQVLLDNRDGYFSELLGVLLNTALSVVKEDLTGQYSSVNTSVKTFLVEKHEGKKVVRGSLVSETCEFQVIKDIHSWFIVHPKPSLAITNTKEQLQC